jgi:hypothetical protein
MTKREINRLLELLTKLRDERLTMFVEDELTETLTSVIYDIEDVYIEESEIE